MCEEKQRLLETYETAEAAYSESLTALAKQAGTLSRDDYAALKMAVDSARMESERARVAFDAHACLDAC